MIDRTIDFRRRSNRLMCETDFEFSHAECDSTVYNVVDRFSFLSATVFVQLKTLDALIKPYRVSPICHNVVRGVIGGVVDHRYPHNVMHYIMTKRELFESTDIKDVVHNARIAGDLISQMTSSIHSEIKSKGKSDVSRHLHEHRLGVIACLQHLLKSVQWDVEEYERYKLSVETNLKTALALMTENQMKHDCLLNDSFADSNNKNAIATDYIRLFTTPPLNMYNDLSNDLSKNGCETPDSITPPTALYECSSIAAVHSSEGAQPLQLHSYLGYIGNVEQSSDGELQLMQQEHKSLLDRVKDSMQMSELKTINNVQQRLTEISSMFEQFSGTLAVQLDMFESINANDMETLSNIVTTEDTLQQANKENIPYHQLLMCYSFVGAALFLLLVDYLKSYRGSYLF